VDEHAERDRGADPSADLRQARLQGIGRRGAGQGFGADDGPAGRGEHREDDPVTEGVGGEHEAGHGDRQNGPLAAVAEAGREHAEQDRRDQRVRRVAVLAGAVLVARPLGHGVEDARERPHRG